MKRGLRVLCAVLLLGLVFSLSMISTASASKIEICRYYRLHGTHDWYMADVSKPTCTSDGYYVLKCRYCTVSQKERGDKRYGHDWENVGGQDATCTKKGSIIYRCSNCKEETTETIMPIGHYWVKSKTVSATCSKEGYVQYACNNSGCKETKKETLKKIDHKWKTGEIIEQATCVVNGKVKATCTMCGTTTTRTTDKIAHAYGMWQITVAATDCTKGVKTRSCTVCRQEEQQEFYPEGTLYRNIDDEEAIKELQTMLKDCGYLSDKVDGSFGKNTESAVKAFQKQAGIIQDGIAWPQTKEALKQAWQVKLGITPVPTETPAPTATPSPKQVLFCSYEVDEQGLSVPVYCEVHQTMLDSDKALMAAAADDNARIEAVKQIRTTREAEVDRLYNEWFSLADDMDKGLTVSAHAMFKSHLAMQEAAWNKQYEKTPLVAAEMINELMLQQTVDLCSIVYGFKGIPVTTDNGYVTAVLVNGWYKGEATAHYSITLYNDDIDVIEIASITITDHQMGSGIEQEMNVLRSAFDGAQFTEIVVGENSFYYIADADDTAHFALVAATSTGKAMKVEGKACTLEQAMPLLETIVIR